MRKTFPHGRVFRTEESSVQKTLLYGRVVRAEASSVYRRLVRTDDLYVRKLTSGSRLVSQEIAPLESGFLKRFLGYLFGGKKCDNYSSNDNSKAQ